MLGVIAGYVRRHHIGLLALFLALSGTAYAAALPRDSIVGPKQLKRNAVTSAKVRNGTLQKADFAAGTLLTGSVGPTGPAGPQGERGVPGANAQFGPVPSAGAGQGPAAVVADGGAIAVPLDIELYDTEGLPTRGGPRRARRAARRRVPLRDRQRVLHQRGGPGVAGHPRGRHRREREKRGGGDWVDGTQHGATGTASTRETR